MQQEEREERETVKYNRDLAKEQYYIALEIIFKLVLGLFMQSSRKGAVEGCKWEAQGSELPTPIWPGLSAWGMPPV